MKTLPLLFVFSLAFVASLFGQRAVQFREVNFTTGVIEMHNFGDTDQDLTGWRFCSHDEEEDRRYSSNGGLNGVVIAAGSSLFVHFLNDAPAGDANAINIAGRGNFADPLDRGPYAIQIYFQTPFGNTGTNIADHLQWSIDGVDDESADFRSAAAEGGGVWTDQSLWIPTTAESTALVLTDTTGGILHGPDSYEVIEPIVAAVFPSTLTLENPVVAPNGDVTLNWEDLSEFGTVEYILEMSPDLTEEASKPLPGFLSPPTPPPSLTSMMILSSSE